jgi:hypothetical protein
MKNCKRQIENPHLKSTCTLLEWSLHSSPSIFALRSTRSGCALSTDREQSISFEVLEDSPLLALMEEDVVTSHKGATNQNRTRFLLAAVDGLTDRTVVL